ncbi:ATP-binding cassette domain-containing protein [Paenibacillus chondroitinus]|uniref:ATP-binding cassette domain-containing protein n=1 Tax=Paenibacillus chondroitinus TaxID=59842 RepID=A0ABU6DKJ6_9BACL|nr:MULTISPECIES: ATP-binding cassette domain-containing protein [Paenibacillus]MCY9662082.1 ATP-binding cassette domain-containing protein [Paenibacillus anseongense]MEB4798299.1 ATP-binding cassette domain-containing protein [Paenibacillus chondroitinus]
METNLDSIPLAPLLEANQLVKRFGELLACNKVDLQVLAGEVHAILGENGAGKSTLMKMISGVYSVDEGTMKWLGEEVRLQSPAKAKAQGIGMVYQDFRLVPALSVLENIVLAITNKGVFMNRTKIRQQILEVSVRYGISVNPDAWVWQLDLGERQRVEILKVLLMKGTRLIIFDEPTSVLTPIEVDAFLQMLDRLRKDHYAVLLITHKINEVMAVADRVTVLRHGSVIYTATQEANFTGDQLVASMMGMKQLVKLEERTPWIASSQVPVHALQGRQLTIQDDHGQMIVDGIDISIEKGKIVGIAGISGNGQKELFEALFGLRALSSGSLIINGINLTSSPVKAYIDAGMVLVSEDPLTDSVIAGFTILEHMVLAGLPMKPKGLGMDWSYIRSQLQARKEVQVLGLADPDRRADRLSGGNVQRMILSRALLKEPSVLLVSYPSRGLDIGTTRSIQNMLIDLADKGAAILLISEDLGELFALSDELLVLSNAKLHGPFIPSETDAYTIGQIMLKGETA